MNEFRIVSDTRGRLRVRVLGAPIERRQTVERLAKTLGERSNVADVHVNPGTGSVTLHYDDGHEVNEIVSMLTDAGLTVERGAHRDGHPEPAGTSETATRIMDAATDLDARLSKLMGRRIDLKSAVPLAFLALGAWKTATSGLGWPQLPAYQLFWYAYATFRELDAEPELLKQR